jgi:protein SCO1/2
MLRKGLWIAVALALVAAAAGYVLVDMKKNERATIPGVGMPADVQLVDQKGAPFTAADLKGRPSVVFFGFTYCPEICPTTLLDITRWLGTLGRDADKLNVVFVTIDPARDTPGQMATYLTSFDSRIRGVSGTPAEIDKMAKGFRVYYRRVDTGGGDYTMDHSTAVYLLDAKGRFVEPIGYQEPADRAVAKLKRLAAG